MVPGHREWEIGAHLLHFEPPDILWVKYRGPLSLPESIHMMQVSGELGSVHPFFMVGDMRESGLPEQEAGRYLSENLHFESLLGSIFIGTRLAHRAAAKGIMLAAYLTESTTDARILEKVHFVPSREEALALILRLRARAVTPPVLEGTGMDS